MVPGYSEYACTLVSCDVCRYARLMPCYPVPNFGVKRCGPASAAAERGYFIAIVTASRRLQVDTVAAHRHWRQPPRRSEFGSGTGAQLPKYFSRRTRGDINESFSVGADGCRELRLQSTGCLIVASTRERGEVFDVLLLETSGNPETLVNAVVARENLRRFGHCAGLGVGVAAVRIPRVPAFSIRSYAEATILRFIPRASGDLCVRVRLSRDSELRSLVAGSTATIRH